MNGQNIPLTQAQDLAFQISGSNAVTQLIDFSLLDQEAKKDHVTVSKADLDARLDQIRDRIKPESLDQALKERNMSMAMLTDGLTHVILREKLVSKNIPGTPMRHVRHILIQVAPPGVTPNATGPNPQHSDADAQKLIATIQADLAAGKPFDDEAKKYSEDPSNKDKGGDLGIINQTTPFDPAFLKAAMALKPGETTATAVKSQFGYHIIQCISTSDSHPVSENKLYSDASDQYKQQQIQFQAPAFMQQLTQKAKVTNYLALGSNIKPAVASNADEIELARDVVAGKTAQAQALAHKIVLSSQAPAAVSKTAATSTPAKTGAKATATKVVKTGG